MREAFFDFRFSLFALLAFSGCGTPGDPRPPRPVVPATITDLAARQAGSRVVLTFTLPRRSSEGEALAAPPDIEIYRGFTPSSAAPAEPQQLALTIPSALVDTYVTEGRVQFEDPVKPEDLSAHRDEQWVYAVRTRVSPKRNSDPSNLVTVRVLPPPAAPAGFAATVTESAIELRWQAVADAISYRIFRAESAAATADAPEKMSPAILLAATPATSYRDTQFEIGRRYLYTVRAVAQFAAESVESEPSEPANVFAEDVFPPAAPGNLVIILTPATADTPAALELSWSISAEPDAAGYHVYRSEQEGTPGVRISTELLPAPAFRDTSVVPGRRYFYWVTAVDRKGNESTRSVPVSEAVPGQGH